VTLIHIIVSRRIGQATDMLLPRPLGPQPLPLGEIRLAGVAGDAAVNGEVDAGDVGGVVRGEEGDGGGDVLRLRRAAQRDRAEPEFAVERAGE
jgi:hypothetical protein